MPHLPDAELAHRARSLTWLLCDVDGVLNDGRIYYEPHGEGTKPFDVKDGLGLKLAQRAGLKVGVLSGRGAAALERRADDLGLDAVITRRDDKGPALAAFLEEHGVRAERVAYIGDDLPDLAVIARVGLSFAPADAVEEVRAAVDRVLERGGGRGVVREMVEVVLAARGEWEGIVGRYGAGG